jgi:hypothetical protein
MTSNQGVLFLSTFDRSVCRSQRRCKEIKIIITVIKIILSEHGTPTKASEFLERLDACMGIKGEWSDSGNLIAGGPTERL